MPKPLAELLPRLDLALQGTARLLLFSDFDGTLTPIQVRPEACRLELRLRQLLTEISRQAGVSVGIVSGRQLDDLRSRVDIPGIIYAGNHGLEIEAPGLQFREPRALLLAPQLNSLVWELSRALLSIHGAWVEHKCLTASVHFREVAAQDVPRLEDTVRRVAHPSVLAGQFVLRPGKAVMELRPAVDWNKASAVLWLTKQLADAKQPPLLMYFGDDHTDEDVFSVLPNDVTVCVAGQRPTSAQYLASDPEEVGWFLAWLLNRILDHDSRSCLSYVDATR